MMLYIPMAIYVLATSLIGCILLCIFNKKLESNKVTLIEHILWITTIIGIILLFFANGLGSSV